MSEPTLHCSFCGKSQHDVKKLIAGPKGLICDECVSLCAVIIVSDHIDNGCPVGVFYLTTQKDHVASLANQIAGALAAIQSQPLNRGEE